MSTTAGCPYCRRINTYRNTPASGRVYCAACGGMYPLSSVNPLVTLPEPEDQSRVSIDIEGSELIAGLFGASMGRAMTRVTDPIARDAVFEIGGVVAEILSRLPEITERESLYIRLMDRLLAARESVRASSDENKAPSSDESPIAGDRPQ